MVFPPDLLDMLEAQPSVSWAGLVYRHVFGENFPVAENVTGARWNPPGTAAIYATFERRTALAEGNHAIAVQPLRPKIARWIYSLQVEVRSAIDLSDRDLLAQAGVTDVELASDDHTACQLVGGAAAWLGRDGLIVPSARDPGNNLVMFTANLDPNAELVVVGKREPVSE